MLPISSNSPYNAQFDALKSALIKQKETSSTSDETLAVMFMGKQYDSFPRELIIDDSIMSIDKYAWQRLYIELQQNHHYFPSYNNLQNLWGNLGKPLSRKTVRDILSRLVLSGWLSYRAFRSDNGQVIGNVYMLHNIKLETIQIITQDESVSLIFNSIMNKKEISKSLALLSYNLVKTYLDAKEQPKDLFLRISGSKSEMVITNDIDNIATSLLLHLENKLSSKKELDEKTLSSKKELGQKTLSSKKELSENALSSKKELHNKTMTYDVSSSSSINSSTTKILEIPKNLNSRINGNGIKNIIGTIKKTDIDIDLVNKILISISLDNTNKIKNMTAYLVEIIKRAAKGEYNIAPCESITNIEDNEKIIKKSEIVVNKKTVSKQQISEILNSLKGALDGQSR